jgi:hypothetical protein
MGKGKKWTRRTGIGFVASVIVAAAIGVTLATLMLTQVFPAVNYSVPVTLGTCDSTLVATVESPGVILYDCGAGHPALNVSAAPNSAAPSLSGGSFASDGTSLWVFTAPQTFGTSSCTQLQNATNVISDTGVVQSSVTFGFTGGWSYCLETNDTSVPTFSISWSQS